MLHPIHLLKPYSQGAKTAEQLEGSEFIVVLVRPRKNRQGSFLKGLLLQDPVKDYL